jgi:glycosyltransferase involved in cell wall biosynthesis
MQSMCCLDCLCGAAYGIIVAVTDSPMLPIKAAHVGLNAQLLSLTESYRGAGINGYIYGLLQHLPDAAPDLRFSAFVSERRYQPPPGLEVHPVGGHVAKPMTRILWEQFALPQALRTQRIDLIHGLAYALPLGCPCRSVVTIHDLSFFRYPRTLPSYRRIYLKAATRLAIRQADRVVAVSHHTAQELADLIGVESDRIDVVHNGVDDIFRPAPPDEVERFRRQHGLPDRFILFLGTLEPRKNIGVLIRAYAQWQRAEGAFSIAASDTKLVIAGGKGWYFENLFALTSSLGLEDDVLFPGFVPASDLPWWYRAAACFVYPSIYEGFGLPVLEAMACGTPVIVSSASSLPEVAGDAALIVDPLDVDALTEAIDKVLSDRALGEELRLSGLRQAAGFSWQRCAQETAAVYRTTLKDPESDYD